jgi:hypothetical protein
MRMVCQSFRQLRLSVFLQGPYAIAINAAAGWLAGGHGGQRPRKPHITLAFLSTVRTERFDEVLALRTVLSILGERCALPIAP